MTFAEPLHMWLLLGLGPAVLVFLVWTWRQKQAAMERFIGGRLREQLTVARSVPRQILKRGLLLLTVATLLLALARPRWGFTEEETRASGLDIVLCFDVSRSMSASDIRPNRLARAKLAASDLIDVAKSDRLGLVAFAGTAFLQCPLALDPGAFRQSVAALDVDTIPEQGTALREAIDEARQAFQDDSSAARAILVVTEGEDHVEGAVEAARTAYADGIRVFTLGVGSAEGEVLRSADPYGNPVFVRDEDGNAVRSRLNEGLLKEMAAAGGGLYLPLQNARSIETLYQRGLAVLPKGEFSGGRVRQWRERFQWPLALALALMALEVILPEHRTPRRRRREPEGIAA